MKKIIIKKPVAKEIEPVFGYRTENRISGFRLTSLIIELCFLQEKQHTT